MQERLQSPRTEAILLLLGRIPESSFRLKRKDLYLYPATLWKSLSIVYFGKKKKKVKLNKIKIVVPWGKPPGAFRFMYIPTQAFSFH